VGHFLPTGTYALAIGNAMSRGNGCLQERFRGGDGGSLRPQTI
jgi:hypothetical protein